MDGILLVDKPRGWTSHDLCQYLKKKFRFSKVGHAGTLDPEATGLMLLLLNKMTRMSSRFLQDTKTYLASVRLGIKTSTLDLAGTIEAEKSWDHVSVESVYQLEKDFLGEMEQIPPMVSAKKVNGVRLYQLARQGKIIPREPKKVAVYDLQMNQVALPEFSFRVKASKGFYVRSLAESMGEALGTYGTLVALRRIASGSFSLDEAIAWESVQAMKQAEELTPYLRQFETTAF